MNREGRSSFSVTSFAVSLLVLVASWIVAATAGRAQLSTASINGTVRDVSGGVIPEAPVVLRNMLTGVERSSKTNETGTYVFLNVLPGRYELRVSKEGFGPAAETDILAVVGEATTHDFALSVGATRQSVTVEATPATIVTATAGLGTAIMERQATNLPLNGRNFTQLLLLTPGASPINTGQSGAGWSQRPIGDFSFPAFHGQANKSALYVIDGIMNSGVFFGGYSFAPNIDEIQELKVQSHTDQSEFGQSLGGTVNVVTKSGTNDFHGAAWEFLRNNALDARNFFARTITPLKQNQFGFNVGGPALLPHYNGRNRTFFYGSYEGFRKHTANLALYNVPTAKNLQGDFSDRPQQIFNPYSTRPDPDNPGRFIRDPFPGNIVPAQFMDPKAVAFAQKVYPAPLNTGFVGFNGVDTSPAKQDQDQFTIRVDQQVGPKDSFWFRYTGAGQTLSSSRGQVSGNTFDQRPHGHNYGVSYLHTFGPTWMVHGLFGRNLLEQNVVAQVLAVDYNTFPTTVFAERFGCNLGPIGFGSKKCQMPSVLGNALGLVADANQTASVADNYQYSFDVSHVSGRHTLRWGATWSSNNFNHPDGGIVLQYGTAQTANPNNLGVTGDPVASFLMGLPAFSSRAVSLQGERESWIHGYWVQDTWKVTDRLTINLGLRYDINFQGYVGIKKGDPQATGDLDFTTGLYILQKVPGSCDVLKAAPCIPGGRLPQNVSVSGQKNGSIWHNDYRDFGPRLGFAYRVNDKTAIRASFARYFDNWMNNIQNQENIKDAWPSVSRISSGSLNAQFVDAHFSDPLPISALPAPTPFDQLQWSVDPYAKSPYSDQWNFSIERQLTPTTTVTGSYVGSHDGRVPLGTLYNVALTPGPGNPRLRAPFPFTGPGFFTANWGRATYNAFEFTMDKRFSRGLSYLVSYTWSKTIDIGADPGGYFESYSIQDVYNFNADKSVAGYDLPHILKAAWVWELPWRSQSRPLDAVVHGWHFNGIATITSGVPFNPVLGGDNANIGNNLGFPLSQRPNLVGDPHLSNPTVQRWFNTSAFVAPLPFTFGSSGRNILRADGFKNFDMGIFRDFHLRENKTIQFRFESFNIFNMPSFGRPGSTIGLPTFGRVSGTRSTARQIQFALKFLF